MNFTDWRDVDAAQIAPLYEAETRRWREGLGWELAASWAIVESGRRAGRVPGIVAHASDGQVAGWTFFILHENILQVGGVVASKASVTRALLERAMQSHEARLARGFSAFLYPASSSLPSALIRQRFAVGPHPYMVKPLVDHVDEDRVGFTPGELEAFRMRPLDEVDPADVVRLLARAYAGLPEAKCFAPDARLEQWAHYVGQLLATPAIGHYLPAASLAVERQGSRQLQAAVITTALSPETAHIAQIVVDPSCRRSGLARRLVAGACHHAHQLGHARMSLLVSGANEPAQRLYAALGFTETTRFIYASRTAIARQAVVPRPAASVAALRP